MLPFIFLKKIIHSRNIYWVLGTTWVWFSGECGAPLTMLTFSLLLMDSVWKVTLETDDSGSLSGWGWELGSGVGGRQTPAHFSSFGMLICVKHIHHSKKKKNKWDKLFSKKVKDVRCDNGVMTMSFSKKRCIMRYLKLKCHECVTVFKILWWKTSRWHKYSKMLTTVKSGCWVGRYCLY